MSRKYISIPREMPLEQFTYTLNTQIMNPESVLSAEEIEQMRQQAVTGTITVGSSSGGDGVTWTIAPDPVIGGPTYWRYEDLINTPNPVTPSQRILDALRRSGIGVQKQDIVVPEGLEMVKDCQIETIHEKDVTLEFHIKGPTIPKELLTEIPPEMFKRLDFELKMAMIRAFNLVPNEEVRKRLVILDEVE
jgi:hypothetical protein